MSLKARLATSLLLILNPLIAVSLPAPDAVAVAPRCGGSNTDLKGLVGKAAPIILVHGWTGSPMSDTRTALEALPSHVGRQYLLFDYAEASTKWADDPEIAGCLAAYVKQVSDTNRSRGGDGMVYLVAHSMGGLAIRFALDPRYGGIRGLVDRVGGVVSLDTPYRGSMWGDSAFALLLSVKSDVVHGAFPGPDARAWHCLAGGPRLRFPSDCATPPPLDPAIPLLQVAGDVSVRRTLFGFEAYTLDMGGDGIVDSDSERGSVGGDGDLVATQAGFQDVACTVDTGDLSGGGPVGLWANMASDNFLLDFYHGNHSANDVRVVGEIEAILTMLFDGSCSHVGITHDPAAIAAADATLATMIKRQHGLTKPRDLINAPVPASCRHPAVRLKGASYNWDSHGTYYGDTWLDIKGAEFGDVTGDGRSDAVAVMTCTAGGVSWPQFLLVYGPGTRLVGSYDLATIDHPQEHVVVTGMRLSDGGIDLGLESYEGAGFDVATYTGRLTWKSSKASLAYDGPLTIDFAEGRDPSMAADFGAYGYVKTPSDADIWLSLAPDDFKRFIVDEWRHLDRAAGGCEYPTWVTVDRYSHLGFASGGETACGGAAAVWSRSGGSWHTIGTYQDGPYCARSSDELRQALTALGLGCYAADNTTWRSLGNWPSSGQ